ncbi:MAG: hypothetical protein ETSY2_38730 [Candidatus Entotheonella gemina]|uniref:beta-lactamase n=2 Tax=Candidatus Entotheonella TaxID=93171 RepID=W4LS93_9BACT|nr:MAG: hypothetical protein ETSY2_38730 [Candidatus Entotheonella gemina]
MATDWSRLEQAVKANEAHGSIGVSAISPCGERWEVQGKTRFPAASTVKIPIMIEIYRGIDRGELAIDDTYIVRSADKAPGSGVLQHMHAGLQLSLGDLLYLMMSISDNTATNILIDMAGMDRINATMQDLGMAASTLGRPMRGRLAIEGEEENWATPNDYTAVVKALIDEQAASPAACQAMLTTLTLQQNHRRIGRYVPASKSYRWGSKTGSNTGITNDVGFVQSPAGTMIIALYSQGIGDAVTSEIALSDIAEAAMQATGII